MQTKAETDQQDQKQREGICWTRPGFEGNN